MVQFPQAVRVVAPHPGFSDVVAAGTNGRSIALLASEDLRILEERPDLFRGSVYCAAWSADGELLASGSNDQTVQVLTTSAGRLTGEELLIAPNSGTVRALEFLGRDLLTAGQENAVRLWDAETGSLKGRLATDLLRP